MANVLRRSGHLALLCSSLWGLISCGGDEGTVINPEQVLNSPQVTLTWEPNPESAVNQAGGGYFVYYSQTPDFSLDDSGVSRVQVPYVSGDKAPTQATINFPSGTIYVRLTAYSDLINPFTERPSESAAGAAIQIEVP